MTQVRHFVTAVQMDVSTYGEVEPLNESEAAYALEQWKSEGVEIPDGITPQMLMTEWNRQI